MPESYNDGEVLGVDADGCLILWDADKQERYNCGETLASWGEDNLTTTELARVKQ